MVAARLASPPLLPTGVSEEEEVVVWAEAGGASACLVMGVKSGTASDVSATGDTRVWTTSARMNVTNVQLNISPPPSQHFLCCTSICRRDFIPAVDGVCSSTLSGCRGPWTAGGVAVFLPEEAGLMLAGPAGGFLSVGGSDNGGAPRPVTTGSWFSSSAAA